MQKLKHPQNYASNNLVQVRQRPFHNCLKPLDTMATSAMKDKRR